MCVNIIRVYDTFSAIVFRRPNVVEKNQKLNLNFYSFPGDISRKHTQFVRDMRDYVHVIL